MAATSLERLAYISTAYVAGDRHGVVYEHELALGQGFKNHYESTKFQAEVWVRERMHRVPTTILRPAIVVGDSQTGETEKFDGPYYLLRTIARAETLGRPVMQFGKPAATVQRRARRLRRRRDRRGRVPARGGGRDAAPRRPRAAVLAGARRRRCRRPTPAARRRARSRPSSSRTACARSACASCSAARRASRSPTSTTPSRSTPAARSTCSARSAWRRRASATTSSAMVRYFKENEERT